ncbi:MAG: RNA-binding S4 domain-containing protein [Paracoccus sp. (in: a-proteobacteria)]|uniref:RNA-binding S4 domain-containing protein n=1 Tax=Paracoccus sp. TaxID=267 RepID=UPI0026DF2F2B|nr:RNA-binding S4 domain-containing protein [Paracoccus sp. (in: a-proteobacteria)]MDO5621605.1 RNA-binding S4 domain-containing protein [Paracoccus sp. (in: a-proteobacteria)]
MSDDSLRLDKWLFHARIFKSRSLAAERIEAGGVRLNGQPCRKPGRAVKPGDIITISARGRVRELRLLAPGTRRGPAAEAATLYDDMSQDGASPLE